MNGRTRAPERPDRVAPPPPANPAATDIERADERKPGSIEQAPEPDPAEAVPGFLEPHEPHERDADPAGP